MAYKNGTEVIVVCLPGLSDTPDVGIDIVGNLWCYLQCFMDGVSGQEVEGFV
jgi:hypothetical protein